MPGFFFSVGVSRLRLRSRERLADVNDEREEKRNGGETYDDLTGRTGEERGDTRHDVSENRVNELDEDVGCRHKANGWER